MAAESWTDVHHGAPRCLLRLFDAAAGRFADWSEFDAEAEDWGIEVRGLSREDLRALLESATRQILTMEHRWLHQEDSDFVRWGRRGDRRTLALYGRPYFSLLARLRWGHIDRRRSLDRAPCWEFKGSGSLRPTPACMIMVSAYTIRARGWW
jgi:hypothetical protein